MDQSSASGGGGKQLISGHVLRLQEFFSLFFFFFFFGRSDVVSEKKRRVTKTLTQNNGKKGIDINRNAGGMKEDGLGRKSGVHGWPCWPCDASYNSG